MRDLRERYIDTPGMSDREAEALRERILNCAKTFVRPFGTAATIRVIATTGSTIAMTTAIGVGGSLIRKSMASGRSHALQRVLIGSETWERVECAGGAKASMDSGEAGPPAMPCTTSPGTAFPQR